MFSFISLYSVLGGNLLLSFIVALCVWIRSQKYYKPCLKKDKNGKIVNLHDIYDPFHPHDKVYFIQLWFGAFFCFLIKFLFSFFILIFINWHINILKRIYKNYNTDPNERRKMKNAISFWSSIFLVINGVWIRPKSLKYEEIYKRYLGEDYDFTDDKYSIILSNHIGFFDVVTCMRLFAPGFIAKSPVRNFWLIGPVSQGLNCLFVDRTNQENKKQIFDALLERQTKYYEGTLLSPMVNFPEGTCSCCRNILRFKKGPFYALLPVKPMILKINQKSSFHLSVGASNVVLHYFKNLCHFVNTIDYTILPTIRPVDYIFKNNKNLGKEKWQIFANTVRKIYAEVGELIEVNMGMRDLNRYIKAMRTGFYDPFEDTDYEHKHDKDIANSSDSDERINKENNTNSEENKDTKEKKGKKKKGEKENYLIDTNKEKEEEEKEDTEEEKEEKEEVEKNEEEVEEKEEKIEKKEEKDEKEEKIEKKEEKDEKEEKEEEENEEEENEEAIEKKEEKEEAIEKKEEKEETIENKEEKEEKETIERKEEKEEKEATERKEEIEGKREEKEYENKDDSLIEKRKEEIDNILDDNKKEIEEKLLGD